MKDKDLDLREEIMKEQILVSKISIWGAVVLFLISAVVGIAVDSITLILDAAASLVILAVALLTNFSLKRINRPPDALYNFGYSKFEPLTGSLQGGLIIATCIISIKFAIQDIVHAESVTGYLIPVIATFVSGLLGLFIFFRIRMVVKRSASNMLELASLHWYSDILMSFGICIGFLCGILLDHFGYSKISPYVDPVMAIILALFLIKIPLRNLMHSVLDLLDAAPGGHILDKVKKVVDMYVPKSFGVYRVRVRKAGQKVFLDICFNVKANLTVFEIRELANSFEKDLSSHIDNCDVVVHFHPV